MSEAYGPGMISTSFVKTLGKTLCLCLVAIAMDVVWGYTGILSLGHIAFFGLGGYMIGMWLMYARTEDIVVRRLCQFAAAADARRDFDRHRHADLRRGRGVGTARDLGLCPACRWAQMALVVLVPGLLALVFGWLAFRSRVTGVYLSILTQAMTLALALWLFQNDSACAATTGCRGCRTCRALMRSRKA
jgi:urea transport system permease protein